jgi:hypothetical protein
MNMSSLNGKSPSRIRVRAVRTLFFLSGDLVLHIVLAPFLSWVSTVRAQAQLYVGVLGGLSTLSGDARSVLRPGSSAFSSYDPENGGTVELLLGRHFSDHFTIRADYIWNRNELTLTSAAFDNGTQQGYQATRRSSQQSAIADLLVYFRERDSRLRPYLSVGAGLVHFASSQERLEQILGTPDLPPQRFSSNMTPSMFQSASTCK